MGITKSKLKKLISAVNYDGCRRPVSEHEALEIVKNFTCTDPNKKIPWESLLPSLPFRRCTLVKKTLIDMGYTEGVKIKSSFSKRASPILMFDQGSDFTLDGFNLRNHAIVRKSEFVSKETD